MAVGTGRVTAAIIAGGPARRLGGVQKSFLDVGGRTIAERQIAVLGSLFETVVAIANDPTQWAATRIPVYPDLVAGVGPLGGIHAALMAAGEADAVLCVAGDLPFLSAALLQALRDRSPEAVAVAPRPVGRPEPLCARYARELLPTIEARLRAGEHAVHGLLDAVPTAWIDDRDLATLTPEGHSFLNVNTPEALQRAQEIARRSVAG